MTELQSYTKVKLKECCCMPIDFDDHCPFCHKNDKYAWGNED